jgi:Tfp pilus assembly protein PilF
LGIESARDSFQEALRRDPRYAMAYAGVAHAYLAQGDYHFLSPAEAATGAAEALSKGLEIDSSIPDLYLLQASVLSRQGAISKDAEDAYRRAIELDPNDADAHQEYALYLRGAGRYDEGLAEIDRARELDPLSAWVATCSGWILLSAGRLNEAEAQLRQALGINPNFPAGMYFLARVLESEGKGNEAIAYLEKAVNASGRASKYLALLGSDYAKAGRQDDARKMLAELRGKPKSEYVDPGYISSVEAALKNSGAQ